MTWPDKLLLLCLGVTAASFQVSLGAALPWVQVPLLDKILLGDLFMPPWAAFCLFRFGWRALPSKCLYGLLAYLAVSGVLLLVHFSRQDAPYWLGQMLHGLTYYVFLTTSLQFGASSVARSAVGCWLLSFPILLLYGLAAHVHMGRHMGEYSSMSLLLTERFQMLAGNPNKLVAFYLFLALCFALGWRGQEMPRSTVFGLVFFLIVAGFTKSRDVPLIGLMLLATLWKPTRKPVLGAVGCLLVAVSLFGTLAIYWSVLPLTSSFPFLNFSHPSSYWARSQHPYVRMLGEASVPQLLVGRGYAGLAEPYHRLKRVDEIKDALATYNNRERLEAHPWLYVHSPPHNSLLQMSNAGGLLWIAGLGWLVFAPQVGKRRWRAISYLYLACLVVESLSHDSIHYPWPFAGLALVHALEQENAGVLGRKLARDDLPKVGGGPPEV